MKKADIIENYEIYLEIDILYFQENNEIVFVFAKTK